MRRRSNQECRKKGKNSWRAALKFTRKRNPVRDRRGDLVIAASRSLPRSQTRHRTSPSDGGREFGKEGSSNLNNATIPMLIPQVASARPSEASISVLQF